MQAMQPIIKKRKKPVMVASKSLKHLRDLGYIAEIVEKTIPRMFIKKDFIGCIDIIAFHAELGHTIGVQVTSSDHFANRHAKILAEPRAEKWLRAGNRIIVHGWSKKGKAGKRKLYSLREQEVFLSDFDGNGGDGL